MTKKETIYQELDAIAEDNDGLLRPEDVLIFAENPKTNLHNQFEWDDKKASREYRLIQARQLIRLYVRVLPNNGEAVSMYVSLISDRVQKGGGYRRMVDVLSDEDRKKELLEMLRRDIKGLQKKYKGIKELSESFSRLESDVVALLNGELIAA